jgi:hypothetical protein
MVEWVESLRARILFHMTNVRTFMALQRDATGRASLELEGGTARVTKARRASRRILNREAFNEWMRRVVDLNDERYTRRGYDVTAIKAAMSGFDNEEEAGVDPGTLAWENGYPVEGVLDIKPPDNAHSVSVVLSGGRKVSLSWDSERLEIGKGEG